MTGLHPSQQEGGPLSRSLPDAPRWSTELSTQAGGWATELTFHIWEKPDEKNHGWDRWKEGPEWVLGVAIL